MVKINGPVGKDAGAAGNRRPDVLAVQKLLNGNMGKMTPLRPLKEDGIVGPQTINAITEYQKRVVRLPRPDGRVDPGGRTLESLNRGGAAGGFSARGKTFKARLDAFIADARSSYNLVLRIDKGRTAEWQQKHHVAHMFLYNKYKSTKPAKTASGKRTIAWSHLSDAKLKWELIDRQDFLRTSNNKPPALDESKWKTGHEPNEAATTKHVEAFQKAAGIGSGGAAMVSSGLKPCGEPCKCKAGRSKHLEAEAADFNTQDLKSLEGKLKSARRGSIDDYFKKFGLHRPLLNHPSSPEKWHVEALPDAKPGKP